MYTQVIQIVSAWSLLHWLSTNAVRGDLPCWRSQSRCQGGRGAWAQLGLGCTSPLWMGSNILINGTADLQKEKQHFNQRDCWKSNQLHATTATTKMEAWWLNYDSYTEYFPWSDHVHETTGINHCTRIVLPLTKSHLTSQTRVATLSSETVCKSLIRSLATATAKLTTVNWFFGECTVVGGWYGGGGEELMS